MLAEVQCCDGSDEQAGVCPNLCKEIGEEYRTKRDAELKIQRAVSRMYPHGFFLVLIWLSRVPKCGQAISRLPTKRRSGSKEMFKN